ncbi:hypothetical protein ACFSKL_00470 [Belliella marina]|uniref:Uncharacterized protein n=1 Tax=Belliella marina TaxID=1644146 RepID=A0ABW4VGV8_9BACT
MAVNNKLATMIFRKITGNIIASLFTPILILGRWLSNLYRGIFYQEYVFLKILPKSMLKSGYAMGFNGTPIYEDDRFQMLKTNDGLQDFAIMMEINYKLDEVPNIDQSLMNLKALILIQTDQDGKDFPDLLYKSVENLAYLQLINCDFKTALPFILKQKKLKELKLLGSKVDGVENFNNLLNHSISNITIEKETLTELDLQEISRTNPNVTIEYVKEINQKSIRLE